MFETQPTTLRVAALALSAALLAACGGGQPPPSFNWDVRPILSNNCFRCHGPDEDAREAGLRLDLREVATAELPETPGKAAIVPGDPDASELIRRVSATDPDVVMPPPDTHLALSAGNIATLTSWIEARRRVSAALVLHPACRSHPAHGGGRRNRSQRYRSLHPGAARRARHDAGAGSRPRNAAPPRHVHADGVARDAGGRRRLRRRHCAERLRESRRPATRLARLRRAHRDGMARCGTLRRFRRLSRRRVSAPPLSVARLGDRGVQLEHAVRRVRHGAARGRPARRGDESATHRDGFRTPAPAHGRERHHRRRVSRRVRHRPHRYGRHGVPGIVGRLRALSRPQVRPDQPRRLLLADGVLQQHGRRRLLPARKVGDRSDDVPDGRRDRRAHRGAPRCRSGSRDRIRSEPRGRRHPPRGRAIACTRCRDPRRRRARLARRGASLLLVRFGACRADARRCVPRRRRASSPRSRSCSRRRARRVSSPP